MAETVAINQDQSEYWRSARQWVDYQETLDRLLQPVLDLLLHEAGLRPGQRVLDIGCGTGASTIAAARIVGPSGRVTGADISDMMLQRARDRAQEEGLGDLDYVEADAQTHDFAEAGFDQVISRFGVMFFGDPVAAFANIARAVRPGGSLVFLAWSGLAENPWFAVPAKAAIEVLGQPEPSDPRAPGPMAFQDRDYVSDILEAARWQDIKTSVVTLELTPEGSVNDVAAFAARMGPASRILKEFDGTEADQKKIEALVTRNLMPFLRDGNVRVPAVLNLVHARR